MRELIDATLIFRVGEAQLPVDNGRLGWVQPSSAFQKIVDELKTRGIGVIITDHNVRETLKICDHAYIIKDGTIIKRGTPEEIASDALVREIYLGENFELG